VQGESFQEEKAKVKKNISLEVVSVARREAKESLRQSKGRKEETDSGSVRRELKEPWQLGFKKEKVQTPEKEKGSSVRKLFRREIDDFPSWVKRHCLR